jgi:hypothetical protein
MNANSRIAACTLLATVLGASATAQISPSFTYQGELKQNGVPVDGSVGMVARLYDSATGGTLLGQQGLGDVLVSDGLFNVLLNTGSEFGPTAFDGDQRWLEFAVGGQVLSPRQKLTPAPFAFVASTAQGLHMVSGAGVGKVLTSDANGVGAWQTPDSGQWLNNGSNIYFNSGNVGVGTDTPNSNFRAQFKGGAGAWKGGVAAGDSQANVVLGELDGRPTIGAHNGALNAWSDLILNCDALGNGGRVGIGTVSPLAKLDVNGPVLAKGLTIGGVGQLETSLSIGTTAPFAGSSVLQSISSLGLLYGDIHLNPAGGNVGIGTASPVGRLHVNGTSVFQGGNVGIGTTSPTWPLHVIPDATNRGIRVGRNEFGSASVSMGITGGLPYVQGTQSEGAEYGTLALNPFGGVVRVPILRITGGSDIAEPFDVAVDTEKCDATELAPGMVVCIDPENAGKLRLSATSFDRTVAGVISGAGGVNPGMLLTQEGTVADGKHPVALTGRVYCYVDADANGSVKPGDLLTTSETAGHAMRAGDDDRTHGAILGKAMSSLDSGRGLVLVLVSLQ